MCMCEGVPMGNSSLRALKLYKLGHPQLLSFKNPKASKCGHLIKFFRSLYFSIIISIAWFFSS